MFSIIVSITLGVILIFAIIYNFRNIQLFGIESYYLLIRRNNRLRLWDLSSMEGFAALWSFYNILYSNKNRIKHFIFLLIIFISLFYVEQTRMMQIAIILSMIVMYIMKDARHKKQLVLRIVLSIVMFLLFIFTGWWQELSMLFSVNGRYGFSTTVRFDEIDYTLSLIRENPIFGTGLVTAETSEHVDFYEGHGLFNYTDIGIIGLVAQIGIASIFVYILPMIRFLYILIKTRKFKNEEPYSYLLGIYIYLVITSISLIITNNKRIFAWPFCLAFYEYWYAQYQNSISTSSSLRRTGLSNKRFGHEGGLIYGTINSKMYPLGRT